MSEVPVASAGRLYEMLSNFERRESWSGWRHERSAGAIKRSQKNFNVISNEVRKKSNVIKPKSDKIQSHQIRRIQTKSNVIKSRSTDGTTCVCVSVSV